MLNFGLIVIGAHSGVHLKNLISEYKNQEILLVEPVPYNYQILETPSPIEDPLDWKDTKSYKYIKGVSCPKCYGLRSKEQKQNSFNRQKQIEAAEYEGRSHPFKKIRNL